MVIGKPKIAKVELPTGRSQQYFIYRACERFGQPPEWFYGQDKEAQVNLLAYSEIRQEEEMQLLLAQVGAIRD